MLCCQFNMRLSLFQLPLGNILEIHKTQTVFQKKKGLSFEWEIWAWASPSYILQKVAYFFVCSKYQTTSPQGRDALARPGGEWHFLKDELGSQFWKVTLIVLSLSGSCHDAEKYSNETYWFWDGVIAHLSFASCLILASLPPSEVAVKLMQFSVSNLAACKK